jgi:hypothetical protein
LANPPIYKVKLATIFGVEGIPGEELLAGLNIPKLGRGVGGSSEKKLAIPCKQNEIIRKM